MLQYVSGIAKLLIVNLLEIQAKRMTESSFSKKNFSLQILPNF